MATYPQRGNFFCHRAIRRLIKSCAIQEIGATAYALVTVVAHQEDSKRYSGHVTYYNVQLLQILGLSSTNTLVRARDKAIASGWLHYEPGGKGRPGKYWVLIPEQCDALDDSPCDESDDDELNTFSTENCTTNGQETGRQTDKKRDGKRTPFIPSPNPNPKRGKKFSAEKAELPENLQTVEFVTAWADWCQHRRAQGKPIKETSCKRLLDKLARAGPEVAIWAIEHSIVNDYQGLFPEKYQPPKSPEPTKRKSRVMTDEEMKNWNPTDGGGLVN